jgi:hypothetical protein
MVLMRDSYLKGACALLLVLGATGALADPIYRWVDASGVVNYGTAPPAALLRSAQAHQVDASESLATHETPEQLARRIAREKAESAEMMAAREQRLKLELLEQRIASEKARAALLAAQASGTHERRHNDCMGDDDYAETDCFAPVILVGGLRPRHPGAHSLPPNSMPTATNTPTVSGTVRGPSLHHLS